MIDFEAMERYLEARKTLKKFIHKGEVLSLEDILKLKELYKTFSAGEISKCFDSLDIGDQWRFEFLCCGCGEKSIFTASKTRMKDHILDPKQLTCCEKCQKLLDEADETRRKEYSEGHKERETKNTKFYIDSYLNPMCSWKKEVKFWSCWNQINSFVVDRDEIAKFIKMMPYKDFLKTPYWKTVSEKKRREVNYRCQICNLNGKLSVHHRTYNFHGYEHLHLKELVVLCDECHKTHHRVEHQPPQKQAEPPQNEAILPKTWEDRQQDLLMDF